jgi:hypothetical protein
MSGAVTTLPEVTVTATRLPPAPPAPRQPPRLSRKRIDVTFIKGVKESPGPFAASPTFAESGTNTAKITGLRASALITKAGGFSMGGLQLRLAYLVRCTSDDHAATWSAGISCLRLYRYAQGYGDAGHVHAGSVSPFALP